MKIKRLFSSLVAAAIITLPAVAPADDTEIYFRSDYTAASAPPLVMFTLDYTPDLGSTLCTATGLTRDNLDTQCPGAYFVRDTLLDVDFTDDKISRFEMLRAVLKRTLAPLDGIKIGLMVMHDNTLVTQNCPNGGPDGACSNGAYVAQGFRLIDADDSNGNKAAFYALLDAIPDPQGNVSHDNQNKEMYFELFRYLTGQRIHTGHLGWLDFNTDATLNLNDVGDPFPGWDPAIEGPAHRNYISPLTQNCQRVFVINITGGSGANADDSDGPISAALSSGGMGFNVANRDKGYVQMVGWLHDRDLADGTIASVPDLEDTQNVTSFFIAVQPQQVDAAAAAGGTGSAIPFADDARALYDTLDKVFNQVLSVSTTFVSASIPVNVFNRTQMLNDVFIALFQTNENSQPQWVGDVKKLKMAVVERLATDGVSTYKEVVALDALGQEAISPTEGRINHDALTFWTDPAGWDVVATYKDEEIAGRDGRSVNRGGAGQRIPGFLAQTATENTTTRTLYTEPTASYSNGSPTALVTLAWTNSTLRNAIWPYIADNSKGHWDGAYSPVAGEASVDLASFPASAVKYWRYDPLATATYYNLTLFDEFRRIFNFMLGVQIAYSPDGLTKTVTARPWQFGDPLHSRPLPINYGARAGYTTDNPDVRIVGGSNDGFMRMIRNTDESGAQSGEEVWAFMPFEAMRIQKQLTDNASAGDPVHPYSVDGAPVTYMLDNNQDGTIDSTAGDRVILYFGMRRGGRAYYALDISNPDTPKMLWRINPRDTDGDGAIDQDADFAELGYTFSDPVVRRVVYGSYTTPRPVLLFGGGYDPNKDSLAVGTDDSMGNAIFMVDGLDGSLVWKAAKGDLASPSDGVRFVHSGLVDSIPSKVAAVDTTGDGNVDRLYVGDTGGAVWRADFPGSDRSHWTLTKILDLGRHASSAAADDRRFFHAPDMVPAKDAFGAFDAVVIGSGDRANPIGIDVNNWFYVFKDRNTTTGNPPSTVVTHANLTDVTNNCLQETSISCADGFTVADGWKLDLPDLGEKVLSSPLTIMGKIYFTSYVPASPSGITCRPPEGNGYQWALSLYDGTAVVNYNTANDTGGSTDGGTDGTTDGTSGDGTVLDKTDRREDLTSTGIPSDDQYLSVEDGGDKIDCVLAPDFTCQNTGGNAAWKTFWFQQEE